jgi:hypothetical protein
VESDHQIGPWRYVSWALSGGPGRSEVLLMELRPYRGTNGNVYLDLEREISLWPDGRVRRKSPTPENKSNIGDLHPDPDDGIASGDMTPLTGLEFEQRWAEPVYREPTQPRNWFRRKTKGS